MGYTSKDNSLISFNTAKKNNNLCIVQIHIYNFNAQFYDTTVTTQSL